MTFYAVQYHYNDDRATQDEHRPHHRAFLRSQLDAGTLVVSGPYVDEPLALLVFKVESRAQLDEILAQDPFAKLGVVASKDIHEWNVVIGGFGAER